MKKAEYIELVSQHWDEVEQLSKAKSFFELEEKLYETMQKLGQELLERSLEVKKSEDRRKKNSNQ